MQRAGTPALDDIATPGGGEGEEPELPLEEMLASLQLSAISQ